MSSGRRRTIRKDRLRELVSTKRGIAKAFAGANATEKKIETQRRLIQKHISCHGPQRMAPKTAAKYEDALGVPRDEFLEPEEDPRQIEIARLEARAKKLREDLRDEP